MWLIWILNYSVFFLSVVAVFSLFTLAKFLYGWSRQCPTMINTQLISLPNFLIHQFIHPKNTHTERKKEMVNGGMGATVLRRRVAPAAQHKHTSADKEIEIHSFLPAN